MWHCRSINLLCSPHRCSIRRHLERVNGNAAGVDGDSASPHLTGQAIDFGKRGMSITEIAWMRAYLKPLMDAGKLDVEEEFHQACFHISVYRAYLPTKKNRQPREVARNSAVRQREIVPFSPQCSVGQGFSFLTQSGDLNEVAVLLF